MLTRTRTTFALHTESTYDWQRNQWIVPITTPVAQLLKIDVPVVQLGVGARS